LLGKKGFFPVQTPPRAAERLKAILASPLPWLALLLLGLAARFRQFLACPSYWYDEAYLLVNIYDCSFEDLLGPLRAQVVIPPFFLWVLRGLYLFVGGSEWAMRLPSFLASLASLVLAVLLARRVVGSPGWLWMLALCSVSRHALMHSSEVRPYASDFLLTEAILLAAVVCLNPDTSPPARRISFAALFVLALLGPWLSFPSVFVLGAVSLAMFLHAWRAGSVSARREWSCWALLNGLLLLSCGLLWYASARHLYYPGLQDHWGQRFPNLAAPAEALSWLGACLVELGHYGTTGMGIPLLALGALGLVSVCWRSGTLAVLLTCPLLFAVVAAALRRYPLGDRLLFFAVPCLWLLAIEGLTMILRNPRGCGVWASAAILTVLLGPGMVQMMRHLVEVHPRTEFRGAFAYVQEQRRPGDVLWVSHPEVYEVYFGKQAPVLSSVTPAELVERALRGGRLWMITTPGGSGVSNFKDTWSRLQASGAVPLQRRDFLGLEVILYALPQK
jgi:hypothetical protein